MNESLIENLFSAAAPRPDASATSGARRADDPNGFDDHLRQAGSPAPEPWWRAAPDRYDQEQRSPEVDQAPPRPSASNSAATQPPPQPTTSDSSLIASGRSDTNRDTQLTSNVESETTDRNTDTSTAAAASLAPAPPHPPRTAPDKPPADQRQPSEQPPTAKNGADHEPKAKVGSATRAQTKNVPAKAAIEKSASVAEDAANQTEESTATHKPATAPANSKATADSKKQETPVEGVPAKLVTADSAAKPNLQLAAAQVAATVAKETPSANADNAEPAVDSRPNKTAVARSTAGQKQPAQSAEQAGQSSAKRATSATASSAAAKTSAASSAGTAKSTTEKTDGKGDAKQDSKSADDKSSDDGPRQVVPVRTGSNQPAPIAAVVSPAAAADKAAAKDVAADSLAKVAGPSAAQKSSTLSTLNRLDRSGGTLTTNGTKQAGDSPDMPRIDPARFVSRVARAIETAQDREGPLSLRLSPPELGSMRLELAVKQGVMTAKIETDTAAARQALLDNLPALRDRLAEHNIRIERFDVDVRRDGNGDQPNTGPQQRQFQQQQQQHYQSPVTRGATVLTRGGQEIAAEPAPVNRIITDTSINLVA